MLLLYVFYRLFEVLFYYQKKKKKQNLWRGNQFGNHVTNNSIEVYVSAKSDSMFICFVVKTSRVDKKKKKKKHSQDGQQFFQAWQATQTPTPPESKVCTVFFLLFFRI